MGLFDFIEQKYRMWFLRDRLRQQTALVETDIAGWRADQATYRMTLHILGHIKTNQLDTHNEGQLLGDFGLAHTGRAGEKERANRLVGFTQSRTRHLDRCSQCLDRRILTEHNVLQITVDGLQLGTIILIDRLRRNTRNFRNDVFDLGLAYGLFLLGLRQDTLRCASFVDHINRLVGQVTVIDKARGQLGCSCQCQRRVFDAMMFFET